MLTQPAQEKIHTDEARPRSLLAALFAGEAANITEQLFEQT